MFQNTLSTEVRCTEASSRPFCWFHSNGFYFSLRAMWRQFFVTKVLEKSLETLWIIPLAPLCAWIIPSGTLLVQRNHHKEHAIRATHRWLQTSIVETDIQQNARCGGTTRMVPVQAQSVKSFTSAYVFSEMWNILPKRACAHWVLRYIKPHSWTCTLL